MFVITYTHRSEEIVLRIGDRERAIELVSTLARRGIPFTLTSDPAGA